jgi:hypothetical protein
MDNNPVKSRGEVLRQLGTFNRRWSEPTLYANEEQWPLNTSANALKQTRIVRMKTTTNVAHHSQSKCGCHRAVHLFKATTPVIVTLKMKQQSVNDRADYDWRADYHFESIFTPLRAPQFAKLWEAATIPIRAQHGHRFQQLFSYLCHHDNNIQQPLNGFGHHHQVASRVLMICGSSRLVVECESFLCNFNN